MKTTPPINETRPALTRSLLFRLGVFLLPIGILVALLTVKCSDPRAYSHIIGEDSLNEYLQSFCFLGASGLAFVTAWRMWRAAHWRWTSAAYLLLGVGLFFVGMEELSWGQRLFHLATPAYFQRHNFQRELTVHNLDQARPYLHNLYIVVGLYGAFAGLVTRLFGRARWAHTTLGGARFWIPEWYLASYFLPAALLYFHFEHLSRRLIRWGHHDYFRVAPGFFIWKDQEAVELVLALGFVIFLAINCSRAARLRTPSPALHPVPRKRPGNRSKGKRH